jgi:hypothetical protein
MCWKQNKFWKVFIIKFDFDRCNKIKSTIKFDDSKVIHMSIFSHHKVIGGFEVRQSVDMWLDIN